MEHTKASFSIALTGLGVLIFAGVLAPSTPSLCAQTLDRPSEVLGLAFVGHYFASNKGKTPPPVKFHDINANSEGEKLAIGAMRSKINGIRAVIDHPLQRIASAAHRFLEFDSDKDGEARCDRRKKFNESERLGAKQG